MKRLLYLLVLITGAAFSQPVIQTPTDIQQCGHTFDLTPKISEVLGALNPADYTVSFFHSLNDANASTNPLTVINSYYSDTATVYVRVEEVINALSFSVVPLNLIPIEVPSVNPNGAVHNLSITDIPFDGFATFDLTLQTPKILGSQTNCVVTYYENSNDATLGTNPISNLTTYTNLTNNQTIYYRIDNSITGCYNISSFQLIAIATNKLVFPDANFKAALLNANPANFIATDVHGQQITIDTNYDGEVDEDEATLVTQFNLKSKGISSLAGIEGFTNLTWLGCFGNAITALDLSSFPNLTYLNCSENQIAVLDVSSLTQLQYLACFSNNISVLNVAPLVNLTQLLCYGNPIASLDVAPLVNLYTLECSGVSSLDVAPLIHLTNLFCPYSNLTTLNLAPLVNLEHLSLEGNPLTSLNVSTLTNLQSLTAGYCQFTTLDVSNLSNLTQLNIGSTQLQTLFMKNGSNENLYLQYSPNLQYICADADEIPAALTFVAANASNSTVVNSYCTFVPGGNHNTITGGMILDANNNGCDALDDIQPNIRININDGTNQGATFTNSQGNYAIYAQAGSFDITPYVENPTWFNFSPVSATIPFANNNNNTVTQNFCMTANGIHNDVEVVIAPITPARPGFDAVYQITSRNKGNQTISGNIAFVYNDAILHYVSSTILPISQSSNILAFDYTNLLPFESRSFTITLHVNSPTNTPAVNIGDLLNFTATINPVTGDENIDDNQILYTQTVVGSFDPNDITCIEGDVVSPSQIGKYLHYIINFENTGTSPAENIVVKDIIDAAKYDISSLQVMNSSHPVTARLTGNVAEFIFQTINLDSGGHGNILLKVKSKNNLLEGDTVTKKADIFFDYNAPISTNIANTIFQSLSNPNFEVDNAIRVFPNPTKNTINIQSKNNIKSIELYDAQGRILQTSIVEDVSKILDITERQTGIYYLKITSDKGMKVEKVVKE